jgi:hypothetical protein
MRLREEASRADQCLKIETRKPLLIEIERHLIAEHVTEILSKGLCVMLEEERLDDLARYPIFVTSLSLFRVSAISIACASRALSQNGHAGYIAWGNRWITLSFCVATSAFPRLHVELREKTSALRVVERFDFFCSFTATVDANHTPVCVCVIVTQTVSIVSTDFSRAGADTRGHCVCNRAGQDDRPR